MVRFVIVAGLPQATPDAARDVQMAKKSRPEVEELDELIERCAGIDVGQAEVVVCARVPDQAGKRCRPTSRTSRTTSARSASGSR
jgi:hypothetical protein